MHTDREARRNSGECQWIWGLKYLGSNGVRNKGTGCVRDLVLCPKKEHLMVYCGFISKRTFQNNHRN